MIELIKRKFRRWLRIFRFATTRFLNEQYTYRASALAFTTILALVPLFSVILALTVHFPFFTKLIDLARVYIFTNFIPTSGTQIQQYLQTFVNQANRLPLIGIGFLAVTVMALIITVEHTLNDTWQTTGRTKKYSAFFLYWVILLLAPIFIGLSVLLSSYFFSLAWYKGATKLLGFQLPLLELIPLLINTIIFTTLYIAVPNTHVKLRQGIFGGLFAALLFEIAKKAFALYLKVFPSYALIYGTLATIPIFLLWIYISWCIVLYGALITHSISKH